MRGGNEAEVVIAFRAENEASAELEDIRNEAREADRGFQGLNRSTIATGLGFLGLGFGAKEAIQNFQEFNQSQGQIQARLDLLGPAAQKAFDDLKPAFDGIGNTVAATEREIAEAFSIIIANSGGIAPSALELAGAFDVARAAGVDFETAAAAIGQALQGNLEPLQQLLDPSGRKSIPSLAVGLDTVKDSAREAITPIDRLTASFREMGDAISESLDEDPAQFFTDMLSGINPVIAALNALNKLLNPPDQPDQTEAFRGGAISDINRQFLSAAQAAGIIPSLGNLTPVPPAGPTIIFNSPLIDSDERLNELISRLEAAIRNNNRNGIGIETP